MITNQRVTSVFPTKRGPPPDPIKRSPGIAGTMHGARLEESGWATTSKERLSHKQERTSTAVTLGDVAAPADLNARFGGSP
jgi:hypothetical protein